MANRETQVIVEVGRKGSPHANATQVITEVALSHPSDVHMTQIIVEVARPKTPGPAQQEILIFAMP